MKKFPYILLASAVLLLGAGCFSKRAPAPTSPAVNQPNQATGTVWPAVPPPLQKQPDGKTATPPPPAAAEKPDGKTATPPPPAAGTTK